jgi:hypothetical protein
MIEGSSKQMVKQILHDGATVQRHAQVPLLFREVPAGDAGGSCLGPGSETNRLNLYANLNLDPATTYLHH